MPQSLCLPSLDDLLADSNAADSDGLFCGFQTLSNEDLDMFTGPDQAVSHSYQHSNNVSGTTCEGRSHSDGSDGEMSQANTRAGTAQVLQTQAVPPEPQSRQAAGHPDSGANVASTNAAASPAEQQASPSLAGMTAAEVAQALGLDTAQQPHAQQGKNSAHPPSAQPPVRKQANGRKKRGRDVEPAATSSGASEQHATSTVAADLTSRAGSPDVSSSTDVTPAGVQQEPSSGANTPAHEEELKRMV